MKEIKTTTYRRDAEGAEKIFLVCLGPRDWLFPEECKVRLGDLCVSAVDCAGNL